MAVPFANVGGVADPRSANEPDILGTTRDQQDHGLHPDQNYSRRVSNKENVARQGSSDSRRMSTMYTDSNISFEEYHFWANKSREYEKTIKANKGYASIFNVFLGRKQEKVQEGIDPKHEGHSSNGPPVTETAGMTIDDGSKEKVENDGATSDGSSMDRYGVTEGEYYHAQRAVRTATWGSVFYLITTDILGPYSVPWAISRMGYGPGAALYITFGILAVYSGGQLWRIFIGLDSTKYPLRNYGDVAFRVYGNSARLGVNVLQSFQFFLNVSLLIVSNGMGLAQMASGSNGNGYLCFVVAEVIFMLAGFVLGQIRTLQRLSFLANLAVWLNVVVIIMTMVVTNYYPPNYAAVHASYPQIDVGPVGGPHPSVKTTAYWPGYTSLTDHINGLMQGVFSYGGATLFNELMAEMRRPVDFWKGLICAEIFIVSVYITMGMVVYSAQGQYAFNPAYQGIPNSAYQWQTLGNAISFISGLIAALLYGNIGVKVFYSAVLRDVFHLPPLDKKTGKWLWVAVVPVYWGLAFIVGAAIPQISYLSSFVGAACILQFSYTFPPILKIGYNVQKDAMRDGEGFDPSTGQVIRHDHGFTRWKRGFMKQWHVNTLDFLYFLGALSVAGLGIYASVIGMHQQYQSTAITPFSCANPAG